MTSYSGRGKARQVDQSDEEEDVNMKSDNDSDSESRIYPDPESPPRPKGFCSLPLEIRERILILACGLPRVHHRRDPGLSTQCTKTINRLSLVNRALYTQMMPILYENVRLTRPSDLRIFHTTVTARPTLGQYVKRLHIGAVEPFSEDWWPIHGEEGKRKLRIALVDRPLEELKVPSWLCPTHAFDLEEEPKTDLDKALRAAITAASRGLDVDPLYGRTYAGHFDWYIGNEIGSDLWHIRVYELQAAFELYLAELGRCERAQLEAVNENPEDHHQSPFPRLAIRPGPGPSQEESSRKSVFWLSRSQIMEHTTRRRSRADHFEHPLLLCRSGMPWKYRDSRAEWHRSDADMINDDDLEPLEGRSSVQVDVGFRSRLTRTQSRVIDFADAGAVMPRLEVTNPLDPELPNIATVGGITALVRSLLSFTPFVESLSLTGFLERIVGGVRPPPAMSFLRSLSLGPPLEKWCSPLDLSHTTLATVEKLRICGRELADEEIACVAGKYGALPSLRNFQWSNLGGQENFRRELSESITSLISAGQAATANLLKELPMSSKRQRRTSESEDGSNGGQVSSPSFVHRAHPLHIEVRLNSIEFKEVMEEVPSSDQEREAWRSGDVLPNSRAGNRFKIVTGVETGGDGEWSLEMAMKTDWIVMDESREWWEAGGTDP